MADCSTCSTTSSKEAKEWPDATISTRNTMNPYILAMAEEQALKQGIKPWEFINTAIWEKLGKPSHDELMEFAANISVDEDDPKWKKRLRIAARFEVEKEEFMERLGNVDADSGNGSGDDEAFKGATEG